MLVSLIIVFVLSGCGNQVKPVPTPTKEPVAQIEQPTVETEEPTEDATVVPTEEPTEVPTEIPTPTEEPTQAPLPDACPVEHLKVASPEKLFLDLGEYGVYPATETSYPDGKLFYNVYLDNTWWGENLATLIQDGGVLSFQMPSPGVIIVPDMIGVTVDNVPWNVDAHTIMSPEGNFIVKAESIVDLTIDKQFADDFLLMINFLAGEPVSLPPVLPENSSLHCGEVWELTISNQSNSDISVPLEVEHVLIIKDSKNLLGIVYPYGESLAKNKMVGYVLLDGDIVKIAPEGVVTFIVLDYYPVNQN